MCRVEDSKKKKVSANVAAAYYEEQPSDRANGR